VRAIIHFDCPQPLGSRGPPRRLSRARAAQELEERVDLDGFTALPRADDVLHYALPVCAPYFALQSYKYKVKITPAAGKKGKVAKQAQQMFQKERDATPRERDLIRALTDHEMVMQMISNGRIVSAGASGGGRKK